MRYITLNGWGQLYNSLDALIPEPRGKVTHIPYADYSSYKKLSQHIKKEKYRCDVLIGWSLGAQLAVRLVNDKIIKPKLLVLIAPPFQFVANESVESGMNVMAFLAFKSAFALLPSATLQKFAVMIGQNDSNLKKIIDEIGIDTDNHRNWLSWLGEIELFTCKDVDFSTFPRTLIVHGKGDTIINLEQAKLFSLLIKNSKLEVFDFTGHAPHFHDARKVKNLIKKEIDKLK